MRKVNRNIELNGFFISLDAILSIRYQPKRHIKLIPRQIIGRRLRRNLPYRLQLRHIQIRPLKEQNSLLPSYLIRPIRISKTHQIRVMASLLIRELNLQGFRLIRR